MKSYFILVLILLGQIAAAQTTGVLQGKVIDRGLNEGLPFAHISLEKNGKQIAITQTDFDGNYSFSNIDTGTYDLLSSYVGFPTVKTEDITIKLGQVVRFDIEMEEGTNVLGVDSTGEMLEVVVRGYRIPLIEQDATAGGQTLSAEDIKNLATRDISSIAATTAGIAQADEGEEVFGSGARATGNTVYVDGRLVPAAKRSKKKIRHKKKYKEQPVIDYNTEDYKSIVENEFKAVQDAPLSTFSIDVDRASYANVRRFLNSNMQPPKYAVRIEEMINYFDYNYPQPTDDKPFAVITESSECPWNPAAKLLHIGLQGKDIDMKNAPANNLVFLLDVSGSMSSANKLPLVKSALTLLVNKMRNEDRIAIVVYAGAAGLVLPSTSGKEKGSIIAALNGLDAGGSTAGGEGIQLAYKIAKQNLIKDGNNRVILATDGDFNVGVSSDAGLEEMIIKKRKDNIFLSVLGFGTGNYKDNKMETLADKGNGNYAYIDNVLEAKKTLGKEMGATLYTIAKDVKIQIEFNPVLIESYRLVGYENRLLNNEDFNDDKKDAGELGAGHTVTALYEVILKNSKSKTKTKQSKVDPLKYQNATTTDVAQASNELMTVKLRYKEPKGTKSQLMTVPVSNEILSLSESSDNFRFSAAVAGWGMLLRDSKFKNKLNHATVLNLAKQAKGKDENGYRAEFIRLVETSSLLKVKVKK